MKYGFIADIHLTTSDNLSHMDAETGLSIRTLDKLQALKKAILISVEQGCKAFFMLGDIYDKLNAQDRLRKAFYSILEPLFYDIQFYIVLGNHDGADFTHNYMAEQVLLNRVEEPPVKIIDKPTLLNFGKNEEILCIPWDVNLEKVKDIINDAKEDILCLGHLEITGAVSSTEYVLTSGINARFFDKFRHTYLGHYHRHQTIRKITYVGSPIVKDLSELGVQKGFVIYDYKTNKSTFIELEERQFFKVLLDEENEKGLEEYEEWSSGDSIKEGAILEITLQGSVHWVREARPIVYQNLIIKKPLKLMIKKKIIKEEGVTKIDDINKLKNKMDKIKEYGKEKPEWLAFGISFFKDAEIKFMEGK